MSRAERLRSAISPKNLLKRGRRSQSVLRRFSRMLTATQALGLTALAMPAALRRPTMTEISQGKRKPTTLTGIF